MGCKNNTMTLYTSQRKAVTELIMSTGVYYVKLEYIKRKYEEVAAIFINAYEWYASNACRIVEKPAEAESAVWAFKDLTSIEKHDGSDILKLEAPICDAVFFDSADWTKILNMTYIGKDKSEEEGYKKRIYASGVKYESDVVMTPFYPLFKRELYDSWKNLFRYDADIKSGNIPDINVQAGLWKIEKQWLRHNNDIR